VPDGCKSHHECTTLCWVVPHFYCEYASSSFMETVGTCYQNVRRLIPEGCNLNTRLVQILRFWTLFIVLSYSKNTVLFVLQNTTFWRLDSASNFRLNLRSPYLRTSFINWAQPSRFYLKTETESSLRNVVFCNINMTMDNVQKHNYLNLRVL
jgi:hypothetical protein